MNKNPLYVYVIATAVVWAIVLGLMQYLGHAAAFDGAVRVAAGFYLGMIAMYFAVHIYRWK